MIGLETLKGPFEGIILVIQMHKVVFTPVTLPRRAVLRYFLPIFVYQYLFMILYFLGTIQLLLNNIFKDFLGITTRFTSPFHSISSAGSHFGLILCMLFYSWEIFYLMKFCCMFFALHFIARIPLPRALCSIWSLFWLYSSMSWEIWNFLLIFWINVFVLL